MLDSYQSQRPAELEHTDTLQRVTAMLARAQTLSDIANAFSRELTELVGADTAWVGARDERDDAIVALGWAGYSDEAANGWRRLPMNSGIALTDVVRSGEPQWWQARDELKRAYPARAKAIDEAGQESLALLPLLDERTPGKTIGGIAIGFFTPVRFGDSTRRFLLALAQQCALAILRARAFEAERVARERAEQLQALTAALARAVTTRDVIETAVGAVGGIFGSSSGALALLSDDGSMFTVVGGLGQRESITGDGAAWQRFPNSGESAAAEAARTRTAVRSPHAMALPLLVGTDVTTAKVHGVLVFGIDAPHAMDADDGFLRSIADQCAQALERARLFEAERTARRRAEILQSVTAAIAAADSMPNVARAALSAAVRGSAAPAGSVSLLSDDGEWLEKVLDIGLTTDALADWQRFPRTGPHPVQHVLSTGQPLFLGDRDEYLARFPAVATTVERLGLHASAILPLTRSDGAAVGYLSLHFYEPQRFTSDEVAFLLALARVTTQAVERARLYEDARAARAEAEEARAGAEAANLAKSQFLATMSHELRTPLNAIGGYAELLEIGVHGPVNDEQRNALARIKRSHTHLLSLINEVLNYARLEAGAVRYELTTVGVMNAVASAESFILPQVRTKGLHFTVHPAPTELAVRADADKLGQVLLNLLSNAVKFTRGGGSITVKCRERREPSGRAVVDIAVADTGIGIPGEQLVRVFEPFVQVGRSLSSPHEGTGLGLAISRDLARGMDGELTVESEPAVGSVFTLTLPAA